MELDIPSDFLICWTKDAREEGGTGMTIRIARDYGVPVFNAGGFTDLDSFKNKVYSFAEEQIRKMRKL